MTMPRDLPALKAAIARLGGGASGRAPDSFGLGPEGPGAASGASSGAAPGAAPGELPRAALHEVFGGPAHEASAIGFALGLALRAAGERPLLWVRQDLRDGEAGLPYQPGLAAFGLDAGRLTLVRARVAADVLRAAEEAARCPALGATLVEIWGEPRALDLTATRRLTLAAEASGVALVMVRLEASPEPSAAMTRWSVEAAPSAALEANAPGPPAFAVTLLRHRAGPAGRSWIVEWDREQRIFRERPPAGAGEALRGRGGAAALSGVVVPLPAGGPAAAAGWSLTERRAG